MQRRRQVFLNGVNVVLCGNEVAFHGATIAWGTKVEKEHAMVSLPRSAAVTACIRKSGTFTVSILSSGQSNVARQYGGSGQSDQKEIDKGDVDFTQWDMPVVKGACAQLLCSVREILSIGEQEVVVAKILDVSAEDGIEPLTYDHEEFFSI